MMLLPPDSWEKKFLAAQGFLGLLAAFISGVFFALGIFVAPTLPQKILFIAFGSVVAYLSWCIFRDMIDLLL